MFSPRIVSGAETAVPPIRLRISDAAGGVGRRLVVAIAVLTVVFPLGWVVRLATRPEESYLADPSGLGGGFTFQNFSEAWTTGDLGQTTLNTLRVVPAGALLATLVAVLAGFSFAKLNPPAKNLLIAFVVLAIAVPLPAIIIPLFEQGLRWHFTNSYLGLVLVFGALFAPWGTYFFYSYFHSVPDGLIDSARVDGATELRLFTRIALPLAKPAIATVLVINVLAQWSNLLLALVMLPDPEKQTVIVSIALYSGQYRTGGPVMAAGMLIAALPMILLFAAGQRYMRAGAFAGAVKA
jgi:ABC-type glycerol-3-phosphate transport system permease component